MGADTNTQHRSQHHSSGHYHSSRESSRRQTLEHNKKLRRERLWQNVKRIVFIVLAAGMIFSVIYFLANPEADIGFLASGAESQTERIRELEQEVERLNTELEQYRSGQIPAVSED